MVQATKNQLGTTISSQLDTIHVGIDKIDASTRALGTVQAAFRVRRLGLLAVHPRWLSVLQAAQFARSLSYLVAPCSSKASAQSGWALSTT